MFALIDYFGPGERSLRVISVVEGASIALENADLPAEIRMANFVANAGNIDLYLDDTNDAPEFDSVAFGTFTSYFALDADTYPFNVTPDGDNLTFLYERNLALLPGESRTLLLAGDQAQADGVSGKYIREEKRPVATALQVRLIHGALDAGAVDIYVVQPGEALDGVAPRVDGLGYLSDATVGVEIGTYDLIVTLAGESTVVAGPLRQTIEVAAYTAVLATSPTGGAPYQLIVIEDAVAQ